MGKREREKEEERERELVDETSREQLMKTEVESEDFLLLCEQQAYISVAIDIVQFSFPRF